MTNNPLEISPFYSHLSMMPTLMNAPPKIPSTMYRPNSWMDPTMQPFFYYNLGLNDPNHKRKNATRETTATLKAWLYEHRKNPYPTKNEKMVLAMVTKMTLTQVSTWFANARRRLKKENKLHRTTTNSKSEEDDEDDDDDIDDEDEDGQRSAAEDEEINENEKNDRLNIQHDQTFNNSHGKSNKRKRDETEEETNVSQSTPSQRPKIWSLVDVVQSNETKRINPSSSTSSTTSSSSSSSSKSSSSLLLSTSLSSTPAAARIIHPYMSPSVPYLLYPNHNGSTGGMNQPNSTSSPSHSSEHSSNNSLLSPISSVSSTSCSPTK